MMRKLLYGLVILVGLFGILLLALRTPDIDRETLISRYANTESAFMALEGGAEVHFRDEGNPNGPVLVLLHGSNASLHTWEPLVAALKHDYRLITLDLPGHGLTGAVEGNPYDHASMARFTLRVLSAMGVDHFTLAGNSMGGGVALMAAHQAPMAVERLILIDSTAVQLSAGDKAKEDRPVVFSIAANPVLSLIAQHITPRSLVQDGLAKSFVDQSLVTEAMIARYWELAHLPGSREATMTRFKGYASGEPTDFRLSEITQPTLIVWGDEDRLISVKAAPLINAAIPNSELVVFEGVGHLPQEEATNDVANAIRAFLGNNE